MRIGRNIQKTLQLSVTLAFLHFLYVVQHGISARLEVHVPIS